jgi:hypothetical protein
MLDGERPDVAAAVWCDRAAAPRIVEAIAKRPNGGVVQTDAASAVYAIRAMAQRYRVGLIERDDIIERATAKVSAIATRAESVNSNGGLGPLNRAYEANRLAKQKAGGRAIPYGMAVARLQRAIGEHGAAAHDGKLGPEILRAVFGES